MTTQIVHSAGYHQVLIDDVPSSRLSPTSGRFVIYFVAIHDIKLGLDWVFFHFLTFDSYCEM